MTEKLQSPAEKPENPLLGTLGAMVGALLGGGLIILLSQLRFLSILGGLVMAVCALKGYELLGGQLTKRGILISIALLCLVPCVAYFLSLVISVMKLYPHLTLGQAAKDYLNFLSDFAPARREVVYELFLLYLCTAVGAFSTILPTLKKK